MASKIASRTPKGFMEVACSKCGTERMVIDSNSVSGTCFKCVSKGMNGESIILTDLPQEEYVQFLRRVFTYGRSQSDAAESSI